MTNAMSDIIYVTRETLEQMKAELLAECIQFRPVIAQRIAEARAQGDLKENADYDAAKEAQGILEARIRKFETELATARVIDTSTIDTSRVTILTRVTITNEATGKTLTYQLVSEKEADLKAGKISVTSPIGKGLIGKREGETAEVQAPNGLLRFRVDLITI